MYIFYYSLILTHQLTTTIPPSLMLFNKILIPVRVYENISLHISNTAKQIVCFQILLDPKHTFISKKYLQDLDDADFYTA